MEATGGHPLVATELIAHRVASPDHDDDPPRLDAIVADMLSGLAKGEQRVIEMLSVAEGACPIALIAEALRADATSVLASAELLEVEGLVAPVTADQLQFRHDLIRRAVVRQVPPSVAVARRCSLIAQLSRDPRFAVRLADQFLRLGDLLDVVGQADRDRAVAAAIDQLLRRLDHSGARGLAERYLDTVDTVDTVDADTLSPPGLAARLKAVTAPDRIRGSRPWTPAAGAADRNRAAQR